jgi:hypothetical protein
MSKYNSMTNENEITLPITSFQRYISSYSATEVEPMIFINSNRKDVKRASHLCEGVHTCRVHVRHLGGGGLAGGRI